MKDIKTSYSAASALPSKILRNPDLIREIMSTRKIPPIHVQFIPTNRCNLKCTFCSCSAVDRKTELPFDVAEKIIEKLAKLGTKSVTITGGGEPLLYPRIGHLISTFYNAGIQIGFVTNGTLLSPKLDFLKYVTWCRISHDDYRPFSGDYAVGIRRTVLHYPNVDWALSYVVSIKPNYENIQKAIEFTNDYNLTHIRIVADLLNFQIVEIPKVQIYLRENGVDDRRAIYQSRNAPTQGDNCFICYLKPLIGPDAKVYTCCGVQYALDNPTKNLPPELCIGDALDIDKIYAGSDKAFNGRICRRCYYQDYNTALEALLADIAHENFL